MLLRFATLTPPSAAYYAAAPFSDDSASKAECSVKVYLNECRMMMMMTVSQSVNQGCHMRKKIKVYKPFGCCVYICVLSK
jgi:hypothetical protein